MNRELLTEKKFAEIIAQHGGRVFRVGGCVRDQFMGIAAKDVDFCIVGMVKRNFKELFPDAEECGQKFPVFRLVLDGVKCELAFARTEQKVGPGYKGFKISAKPKITIQDDLLRRDTTVNSMAMDCLTGEVIDPCNGVQDIRDKVLRATGPHFADDPMRAIRLAGQSARLGFTIEPETLALACAASTELGDEPKARMFIELTKVLGQAQCPGTFFRVLSKTKLLPLTFAEIAALSGVDFEAAMENLDGVASLSACPKLRFAALGVALEPAAMMRWNDAMTLPGDWLDAAVKVGQLKALLENPTPENIVMAIQSLRRGCLSIEEFDTLGQGTGNLLQLSPCKAAMSSLTIAVPKDLTGKAIGEWLRQRHIEIIATLLS